MQEAMENQPEIYINTSWSIYISCENHNTDIQKGLIICSKINAALVIKSLNLIMLATKKLIVSSNMNAGLAIMS